MAGPKRQKSVDENELRRLYNRFVQPKVNTGLYQLEELRRGIPDPKNKQPPGTESAFYKVVDTRDGRMVARCHRYERADGSKTLLDPKTVRISDTVYQLVVPEIKPQLPDPADIAEEAARELPPDPAAAGPCEPIEPNVPPTNPDVPGH